MEGKKVCGNCYYSERCECGLYLCHCLESEYYDKIVREKFEACNRYEEKQPTILMDITEVEVVSGLEDEKKKVADNIDHPERYTKNNMECIQEMVEVFGIDAVISFCKCNVWKYRYRATCEDDLKKADWYMNKLVQLKQEKEGLS